MYAFIATLTFFSDKSISSPPKIEKLSYNREKLLAVGELKYPAILSNVKVMFWLINNNLLESEIIYNRDYLLKVPFSVRKYFIEFLLLFLSSRKVLKITLVWYQGFDICLSNSIWLTLLIKYWDWARCGIDLFWITFIIFSWNNFFFLITRKRDWH